ncbi:MAG TPA: hypothetical protein EYH38_02695 [Leucothrix sp.]|nr:hypothetical protein [Leucothrix sp.]
MLYLVSQMILFLIIAVLFGLFVGWLFFRVFSNNQAFYNEAVSDEDIAAIKHRLDTCFDENVVLRRDLKSSQDKLSKLNTDSKSPSQNSISELKEKVKVLLEDLQLRDDTILVLEQTIEKQKASSKGNSLNNE